jgi:hypothetical protein
VKPLHLSGKTHNRANIFNSQMLQDISLLPKYPPSQGVSECLYGIKQQEYEADHCQPIPNLMSETTPPFNLLTLWRAQR